MKRHDCCAAILAILSDQRRWLKRRIHKLTWCGYLCFVALKLSLKSLTLYLTMCPRQPEQVTRGARSTTNLPASPMTPFLMLIFSLVCVLVVLLDVSSLLRHFGSYLRWR
jgi:uncharacterized membrane protein